MIKSPPHIKPYRHTRARTTWTPSPNTLTHAHPIHFMLHLMYTRSGAGKEAKNSTPSWKGGGLLLVYPISYTWRKTIDIVCAPPPPSAPIHHTTNGIKLCRPLHHSNDVYKDVELIIQTYRALAQIKENHLCRSFDLVNKAPAGLTRNRFSN